MILKYKEFITEQVNEEQPEVIQEENTQSEKEEETKPKNVLSFSDFQSS